MQKTVWLYLKSVARKVVLRFWHSKKKAKGIILHPGITKSLDRSVANLRSKFNFFYEYLYILFASV